jgi:hypothetical protein
LFLGKNWFWWLSIAGGIEQHGGFASLGVLHLREKGAIRLPIHLENFELPFWAITKFENDDLTDLVRRGWDISTSLAEGQSNGRRGCDKCEPKTTVP